MTQPQAPAAKEVAPVGKGDPLKAPPAVPTVRGLPQGAVERPAPMEMVDGLGPVQFPLPGKSQVLPSVAGLTRAGVSPVSVGMVRDGSGAMLGGPVDVEVADRAGARAWGGEVGFRVVPQAGAAWVKVGLDFSGFSQAYGGNFADRLRLYAVPECHAVAPEAAACAPVMLATSKNFETSTMTAEVPTQVLPVLASPAESAVGLAATDAAAVSLQAVDPQSAGVMVVAAAAASGSTGDYTADPMPVSGSWAAGLQSGAFTYSYPVTMPASVGGEAPSLAMTYDSGSVDGMTVASNAQSSWVGIGWDLSAGYVERKFHSCAYEGLTGVGDLCWGGMTYFLHLNGRSSELLPSLYGAAGVDYRLRDDPGWQVTRRTGASNGDAGGSGDTGEYWDVRTPDGTRYVFGGGTTPWATQSATNSVLVTPVNGNNAGEPCYSGTFVDQFCQQAWRWGLDQVVDAKGNATTYKYAQVLNKYKQYGTSAMSYHRDGFLTAVEYGGRVGGSATAQALFNVVDRCTQAAVNAGVACPSLTAANAASYPDVPIDLLCSANCTEMSPSYFSTKRLASIQTYRRAGGAWATVSKLTLEHGFPVPGTDETPDLWLQRVRRSGTAFGQSGTLPQIEFNSTSGANLDNRVDFNLSAGVLRLKKYRLSRINSELGAQTLVTYGHASGNACTSDTVSSGTYPADTNTKECFPKYWTPPGGTAGFGWFHKYVVTRAVLHDPATGATVGGTAPLASEPQVTDYAYTGGAAWRYDNDPTIKLNAQSWSDWRGYSGVQVNRKAVVGGVVNSASWSQAFYTYFRGMHGDKLSGGGTKSKTIATTEGGDDETDWDYLAGRLAEERVLDNSSDQVHRIWHDYAVWHDSSSGTPPSGLLARGGYVVRESDTKTHLSAGGVDNVVNTWVHTSFMGVQDTDRGKIWTGMVDKVQDYGTSTTTVDRCTDYATHWRTDAGRWMAATTQTTGWDGDCGSGTQLGRADTYYDAMTMSPASTGEDSSFGALNPVKNVAYTNASTSITATASFDAYGRPVDVVDGNGRKSRTSYSPSTAIPTTVTITGPKPDGTTNPDGSPAGFTTTTTLDERTGLPTQTSDANGNLTTLAYDGLGRLTAVRKPGQQATGNDSITFAYDLAADPYGAPRPAKVTTTTLQSEGVTPVYITSYSYADGLGRTIQTQTTAPTGGGRILVNQRYSDRGNLAGVSGALSATGAAGSGWVKLDPATMTSETRHWYDSLDRQGTTEAYAGGTLKFKTTTVYDGNKTTTTPASGGKVENLLDAHGRVTSIKEYLANGTTLYATTTLGYDDADQLTTVTSPKNKTSTYTYDWLGRRTATSDPDTGASSSTYDNNGNALTATDARNSTVTTDYDALDRPTRRYTGTQASPTVLATWTYDTLTNGNGALTSTTAKITPPGAPSAVDYVQAVTGYDVDGQVTGTTTTVPAGFGVPTATTYTESYTYDAAGHIVRAGLPAIGGLPSESVYAGWTALGLPNNLATDNGMFGDPPPLTTLVDATSYDAIGRLSGRQWASGTGPQRTYTWDTLNRLATSTTSVGGTTQQNDSYTFTGPDLTRVTDTVTGQRQCYTYDDLRRLSHAWTTNVDCTDGANPNRTFGPSPYDQTWTFDTDNTLTTSGDAAAGTTATFTSGTNGEPYHAATTVTRTGTGAGTQTLHYDASGYLLTRTPSAGAATTLTWDALHHLTSSTDAGGTTRFAYSADGTRLIRQTPTETTLTVGTTEVIYPAGGGTPTGRRYYTLGGVTVAMRTSTTTGATSLTWLAADTQASTDIAIDATTSTFTRTRYTPYGTPRTTTPGPLGTGLPTDHGWLGKTLDKTTGLNHLGARYYDSALDQFTAPDPLYNPTNPRSTNPYTYAWGNPIALTDPSGLAPVCMMSAQCVRQDPDDPTPPPGHEGGSKRVGKGGPSPKYSGPEASKAHGIIDAALDLGETLLCGGMMMGRCPMSAQFQEWRDSVDEYFGAPSILHYLGGYIGFVIFTAVITGGEGAGVGAGRGLAAALPRSSVRAFLRSILARAGGGAADSGAPAAARAAAPAARAGAAADTAGVDASTLPGYRSFSAAKRDLGSPGPGNVYDHVVEQSQIKRSGFAPEEVNHPFNMNPVSAETNQIKANYYSTKQAFTKGGTVRDWLTGQSFEAQYNFGMQVLADIRAGIIQ